MKSRILGLVLLVAGIIAGLLLFLPPAAPEEVDILLLNGRVYTLDARMPQVQAIAIRGGRIVDVGSTDDMSRRYTSSQQVDVQGLPVYPGFIDAHAHMEGLGVAMVTLNLTGANSVLEIQNLVRERIQTSESGAWIRGRGWDQNRWPSKLFPTKEMLDVVGPNNPVYLTRVDGHAVWVNSKVLEIAGITHLTQDPDGGKIVRDRSGNPTGIFIDNAIDLLRGFLPDVAREERTRAIELAVQECLRVGLTEVHDMGVDLELIGVYKVLIDSQRFPFRVYAAIDGIGETWRHYLANGPEHDYQGRLSVRAVKLYADGALGSRGAALIEPYSDDPSTRGLTLTSPVGIDSVVRDALRLGFQVCTHAIGDRGNHIVLNSYENAFNSLKQKGQTARFRVEHAQIVHQDDIPRFASIGVLPSMQPTHCTSDMYWAEDRVGSSRIAGAYAWRSMLEHGSIIPGGSDFPVEGNNPLWGFYAAITRQDKSGWPEGGWYPEQAMTREEALKSFTIWAAYAGFKEREKGTIERGRLADLVVLSDDIMEIPPSQILETTVKYTIVDGVIVFSSTISP